MRIIWKYQLDVRATQKIKMPDPAHMLTVQVQDNVPVLWAIVDSAAEKKTVTVTMHGTGTEPGPDPDEHYVGTVQLSGYVWHYFFRR